MIVDTSAIVAILRTEPDADRYAEALRLSASPAPQMSAATHVEVAVVVDGTRDPVLSGRPKDLLATHGVTTPVSHCSSWGDDFS